MAEAETVNDDVLAGLIAATARGDANAFERLYRETSAKLFGVCLRMLARAEAEEVVQDVYVAVWRKADQFDPDRARGMTWLSMMARNRAIDRLRANRSEVARSVIALEDEPAAAADDAAATMQDVHRLDDCLDELEAPRRTLIRTAFFEGATYEELAQRSATPLGTVKSWIRRGLLKLKACLER